VAAPVSSVDILPTVLEAVGIDRPALLDGRSLLETAPSGDRAVLSESFPVAAQAALHSGFRRTERALLRGGVKLIASDRGKREFYDLDADPAELRNRYGEATLEAAELERALERELASKPPPARRERRPDQRTLERLRSLGYVQ
jgi:arylsulfatase A-like enzyme